MMSASGTAVPRALLRTLARFAGTAKKKSYLSAMAKSSTQSSRWELNGSGLIVCQAVVLGLCVCVCVCVWACVWARRVALKEQYV